MRRWKHLILCCIALAVCIFFFTSCNDEKTSTLDERTVIAPVERQGEQWNAIKKWSAYLGKTAEELFQIDDMWEYTWYADGSESFSLYNSYFLFSDDIWKENSKCVAIKVPLNELISTSEREVTVAVMKEMWGKDCEWQEDLSNGSFFYVYYFDCNEMRIRTDVKGKTLFIDVPVTIKPVASEHDIAMDGQQISPPSLSPKLRNATNWDAFNHYAAYIGKEIDYIQGEKKLNYVEEPKGNYYQDKNIGDIFYIDDLQGGKRVCGTIITLVSNILPIESGETIGREFLRDYWGTSFTWTRYEGYHYFYQFQDIVIYIDSNQFGEIDFNEAVMIKTAWE